MSEQEPFRRIQDHRDVLQDINQMRDNLDELEKQVRRAEWIALGGRGAVELNRVDKLTDAIAGSMEYINEDIHELAESDYGGGSDE